MPEFSGMWTGLWLPRRLVMPGIRYTNLHLNNLFMYASTYSQEQWYMSSTCLIRLSPVLRYHTATESPGDCSGHMSSVNIHGITWLRLQACTWMSDCNTEACEANCVANVFQELNDQVTYSPGTPPAGLCTDARILGQRLALLSC